MLLDQDSEHEDMAQDVDNYSKMLVPIAANAATTVPLSLNGYNLFSKTELSHLRIMQFCDSAGCGRIFFDGIINLLREETLHKGLDFTTVAPKRESLLRTLLSACPTPLPVAVPVALENNTMGNPLNYK